MKRTWLLAFLFLTLWQMLPHEGYNMLYAQDMGDESYGGGYECEDDFGHYYSSVPCDDTPCFEKCTICGGQFTCNEFKGHSCEDKNKTHCPYCDQFLTQEEFLYHNCSTQDMGCLICRRPYEDCTCEGPIISPTNPYVTPSNPHVTPGDSIVVIYYPPSNETHTDGSGSNSNNNTQEDDTSADTLLGRYPCDISKWETLTVQQLKMTPGVHYVPNLPDSFLMQKYEMECVANTIAMIAGIIDGTDPTLTREAIRKIAIDAGIDIRRKGITARRIKSLLYDYCAITDENEFSKNAVENYIDTSKKPVMAITDVINNKGRQDAHMVMIVGYDYNHYYCAYGRENPVAVPKEDLEVKDSNGNIKYKLYFYNGKKRVNE